jgi:hypothetical protein
MGARFRRIKDLDGIDEGTGPMDAGIVVSLQRPSLVFLENGAGLHVRSNHPKNVSVTEITAIDSPELVDFKSDKRVDVAAAVAKTKSGSTRLFKVSASSVVGDHGTVISATNAGADKNEAKLKVLVLQQKPLKVSLRQIQVYSDETKKNVVLSSKEKFDPDAIRDHINWVWDRQANISFALGKTDPALIVSLAPGAEGPSRTSDADTRALVSQKDSDAHLTIFFAHKAFDPPKNSHTPWQFSKNGYTAAEKGFCVVADGRLEFTVEHEIGHFLGALDARGKFVKDFGHSSGNNIMNIEIASNGIIPFDMAKIFNKGFNPEK